MPDFKAQTAELKRRARNVERLNDKRADALDALHAQIREAVEAGMSYRQIGEAVGLSYQRVAQVIQP